MDNMNPEPNFEKFPGSNGEVSPDQKENAEYWKNSLADTEFAGDKFGQFGTANETNEFYGEAESDKSKIETVPSEDYDEGIANASELINYGLNAAARQFGVESIVQKIKGFDASGSEDPIKDFFRYIGVDNPEKEKEVGYEAAAAVTNETEFREGPNRPSNKESVEGAFAAIEDMKELIGEVEGADPRYEELRAGARAAGKGVFEYAVSSFGTQGLTELFKVLAMQREKVEEKEQEKTIENNKVKRDDAPEKEKINDGNERIGGESLNPEILKKNF